MQNKVYELIIIGAGPVGLAATFLANYLKIDCLCLERDSFIGGQVAKLYPHKNIYDYPGFPVIRGDQLISNFSEQLKYYNNPLLLSINIIRYEIKDEIIFIFDDKGNVFKTKYVLFTIGPGAFEIIKLTNEQVDFYALEKILYTFDNNLKFDNKRVLVFGGGDSATDYAMHIKSKFLDSDVTLIHRGEKLKSIANSELDLINKGINVLLNTNLIKIDHHKCLLLNSVTNNNLIKEFDYVLVQFGVRCIGSNIHEWKEFECNNKRFVVNNFYETNIKNFYAAGNCTFSEYKVDMILTGISEATIAINKIFKLLDKKITKY